jgi:photosynthetic reaction center H subunit
MSSTGAITGYFDVAQIVLYAFWIFFAGLIIYLRREDKREGYPLESDRVHVKVVGFPGLPEPKTFVLPHGGGIRTAPRVEARESVNATPAAPWPGAPLQPNGDPMLAAVGPGASPDRADEPDLTFEGKPKIVPMRVAPDFSVAPQDVDPRGLPVLGADGKLGGIVKDIWVDLSEPQIRYLEVSLPKSAPSAVPAEVAEEGTDAAAGSVLLPMNFVRVNRKQGHLKVLSILGRHFANVPRLARPDQVTLREEDKVCAYYAAGTLYAKAERAEPLM